MHTISSVALTIQPILSRLGKLGESNQPTNLTKIISNHLLFFQFFVLYFFFLFSTNCLLFFFFSIKNEDSGELVRALKMYSIAYRIRRDNLSRAHPSLVVLLNMLGSIQAKRGEYEEAMKIYELALKDTSKQDQLALEYPETLALTPTSMSAQDNNDDDDDDASQPPPPPPLPPDPQPSPSEHASSSSKGNLLARSVTYREMGTIFEKWDRREEALSMYHLSLDCVAEWKEAAGVSSEEKGLRLLDSKESGEEADLDRRDIHGELGELDRFMDTVRVKKSHPNLEQDDQTMEKGEMEIGLAIVAVKNKDMKSVTTSSSCYDSFFPPHLEAINAKKGRFTASAAAMARGDTEGLDHRDHSSSELLHAARTVSPFA